MLFADDVNLVRTSVKGVNAERQRGRSKITLEIRAQGLESLGIVEELARGSIYRHRDTTLCDAGQGMDA